MWGSQGNSRLPLIAALLCFARKHQTGEAGSTALTSVARGRRVKRPSTATIEEFRPASSRSSSPVIGGQRGAMGCGKGVMRVTRPQGW
jgi:hypothetical protein